MAFPRRMLLSLAALVVPLFSGGCSNADAGLSGGRPATLPFPAGIDVRFNHNASQRYRSPISGRSCNRAACRCSTTPPMAVPAPV